ncbi:hypothetical protein EXN66_Car020751 [Channa argus]|uniref:Uncharacterized protein n=1 Tax=Channa argus TaxID=215402 RepID=A0A6G1QQR3_CHAAH|nr:hypothetical protein EXN66_Car020751 [Channa argus]
MNCSRTLAASQLMSPQFTHDDGEINLLNDCSCFQTDKPEELIGERDKAFCS